MESSIDEINTEIIHTELASFTHGDFYLTKSLERGRIVFSAQECCVDFCTDCGMQKRPRQHVCFAIGFHISRCFQQPTSPGDEHPLLALIGIRSDQPFAFQPNPSFHKGAAEMLPLFSGILLNDMRQAEVVPV